MNEEFGKRLTKIRLDQHLSMAELSQRTGIMKNSLYTYEAGKAEPRLSFIVAIADALGVSLDFLVKG